MLRKRSRSTILALAAAVAVVLAMLPGAGTAQAAATNLAVNRPVSASGQEVAGQWGPELAVDGVPIPANDSDPAQHRAASASRWSANNADGAWIQIDLGAPATLEQIKVRWGNIYAPSYSLQGSADGNTWTDLATNLAGVRAAWVNTPTTATGIQHVRLTAHTRSDVWPVSIWEIEVMGELEAEIPEPEVPFSIPVIPKPSSVVEADGDDFVIDADTVIVASGAAAGTADLLAEPLRTATGFDLPVQASGDGIELVLNPAAELGAEEYTLVSGADGVVITAATRAGLYYGAQTLLQLVGPWSHSADVVAADWSIPAVEIADEPRYEWRGFMLDVARSFFPKDEVLTMIDQMAQYKMNVLHLHLSDDQGWRVAISNEGRVEGDDIDYTLLTSVGGGTAVTQAAWTDLPGRTGFFTADEFAEIIAYADARNIAIVPEIDGPAHAQSMLHSIPQLNSENSVPQPAAGQTTAPHNPTTSVGESTLDVYNEYTYMAMNHVFSQLIAQNSTLVHGERYFHIGGDESFSTENEDYRVYMDRVSDIVTELDAIPMVWHEAMDRSYEELPAGTVIQQWNGGVSNLAKQHVNERDGKIVMSLANRAYLPQTPGNDVNGVTWACGGACGINQFYNWDPTATAGVSEDGVLGVEAAMWGEHVRTLTSIEGMIYPRLMVTAEVGWTPQAQRDITDFRERLTTLGNNLTVQGRNFYPTDGTWNADVVGLVKDTVAGGEDVGTIAVASVPRAVIADLTATLTLNGQTVPVVISVDRPLTYNAAKFDGRQINGLFRFSIDSALPSGDYSGELVVSASGRTDSTEISFTVEDEASPEPTVTVTVTAPTVTVTASPSSTVTETQTAPSVTETVPGPTATVTVTPTVTVTSEPTSTAPSSPAPGEIVNPQDIYVTPGKHDYNGRQWFTTCEPYSQTWRCRTDIWASTVQLVDGTPQWVTGWTFNNLTYRPMAREAWAGNPLGNGGAWTSDEGRQWRTECDTAATGSDACRSYIWMNVWQPTSQGATTFHQVPQWVFNNIVHFTK